MTNQNLKAPHVIELSVREREVCYGINNATRINFPPDRATMFI